MQIATPNYEIIKFLNKERHLVDVPLTPSGSPFVEVGIELNLTYGPGDPRIPIERVWAMVDTGADTSVIDHTLLKQIASVAKGRGIISGVNGTSENDVHHCRMLFLNAGKWIETKVYSLDLRAQRNYRLLLGMDVLSNCKVVLDGPKNIYRLYAPGITE